MAVAKESTPNTYPLHPNKPITTQTVIGVPGTVEDGIRKIAQYVGDHKIRDGRFEFFHNGVVVRVSLSDKMIARSYEP